MNRYTSYIVYDKINGRIIRTGTCSKKSVEIQAVSDSEEVIEGIADDVSHKIVDGKIVSRTPEEIEADKPLPSNPVPVGEQLANITNEQYQSILDRIEDLEKKGV